MINTIINFLRINQFESFLNVSDIRSLIPKHKEVAILGSGSSILKLQNNFLEDKFKIGFNFWIYHEVIPDLYIFEIKPRDTSRFIFWCELIAIRQSELTNTLFLIKDSELDYQLNFELVEKYFPKNLRKNLFYTKDKNLFGRNLLQIKFVYFLSKMFFSNYIIKYRASISYIIYICHNNSKVHLFGIDLDSQPHFWNNPLFNGPKLKKIMIPDSTGKHLHRTVDSTLGGIPINKYLMFLFTKKNMKVIHHNPQNIRLYDRKV